MAFTFVRALALAGMAACSLSGCGQGERNPVDAVAGTSSTAGSANGSGAGGEDGSSSSAGEGGTGTMMLAGYERLTGAAMDLARNLCRCLGGYQGGAPLEGCAFADAHEYSGLRIDSSDSKRCFEQELAPAFPEIVECETLFLESLRDCTAKNLHEPRCQDSCPTRSSCGSLPNYATYSEQKDRCYIVLYCENGQEARGFRCDDAPDCVDASDEVGCE